MDQNTGRISIDICLGSSCFCRGNNRNVEVVRSFMASQAGLTGQCTLRGHLCQDNCRRGPNIILNGDKLHEVDAVTLLGLLNGATLTATAPKEPRA